MDNTTNNTGNKKPIKFVLILIVTIVAAIGLSSLTYMLYQPFYRNTVKEKYYQLPPNETEALFAISDSEDLMFDTKAYKLFEDSCLGNSNNNLIAAGCYAIKDNIECWSDETTVATIDGKEITIAEHPSSYINIIDNCVYYRDDSDRKVYRNLLDDSRSECVVDANCGETVVTVNGIYYIDFATKKLNYLAFSEKEPTLVYNNRIISFAVIGDSVFTLTENKVFGLLNANGDYTEIDSQVDKFFFDGNAYIQKGSKIYRISSFVSSEGVIDNTEGTLINMSNGYLFLADNDIVTRISTDVEGEPQQIYSLKKDEILKTIIGTGGSYEIKLYTEKDGLRYEKSILLDAK